MQRRVIIGRLCAHLTEPKEIHLQQGLGRCQRRTLCERMSLQVDIIVPYPAHFPGLKRQET